MKLFQIDGSDSKSAPVLFGLAGPGEPAPRIARQGPAGRGDDLRTVRVAGALPDPSPRVTARRHGGG